MSGASAIDQIKTEFITNLEAQPGKDRNGMQMSKDHLLSILFFIIFTYILCKDYIFKDYNYVVFKFAVCWCVHCIPFLWLHLKGPFWGNLKCCQCLSMTYRCVYIGRCYLIIDTQSYHTIYTQCTYIHTMDTVLVYQ